MSVAWGIHLAFERSAAIWGDTLQIFAKSPRWWSIPRCNDEDYRLAQEYREKYAQKWWLIHANYLANLSKSFDECQPDIKSIMHDFEVGHHTGFEAVNIHVGKWKWFENTDHAYANMTKNVEYILENNKKNWYSPKFLFEITAWQGSELGFLVDDLAVFYQNYLKDLPVWFCFDTAHARGWWNDLRKRDELIAKWGDLIGIDKLYSFHLNDSKAALGSRLDRHAPLGRGAIGFPALAQIIQWAEAHDKPIFLETTEPELRPEEIAQIRQIAAWDTDRIDGFHNEHNWTHLLKKFQWEQASLF